MTKKIFLSLLTGAILFVSGCSREIEVTADPVTITNPITLETSTADMSHYQFLNDSDPAFVKITYAESLRMFTEKGSGILFYGYDSCYYCNRAVPVLNEAAKEAGITIYYIDALDTLNTSKDDYDLLMEYLEPTFREDSDTGELEFFVPDVIGVKNGEIVGYHVSLVEGFQAADEETQLTDQEKNDLKQDYIDIFNATAD